MLLPWWIFTGVVLTLLFIWMGDRQVSRRRARRLRRLAEHCGFRYSSVDRFGLARRIRDELPGAVDHVLVRDLMYRSDVQNYVYAFTAVYEGESSGLVVLQARDVAGAARLSDVRHGDAALPLGEQYRRLLHEAVQA